MNASRGWFSTGTARASLHHQQELSSLKAFILIGDICSVLPKGEDLCAIERGERLGNGKRERDK
jgi:hypothetical protein